MELFGSILYHYSSFKQILCSEAFLHFLLSFFLLFQISSVIIFSQCFRYLTTMQLAQFATFFVHASLPLFIECDFPKFFSYVILFHGAMFFLLFANFYIQSYIKKRPSKSTSNGVHSNGIKTDINGNGILKKD